MQEAPTVIPPAPTTVPVITPPAVAPIKVETQTGGFLDHIKLPESSPADNKQTPSPATSPETLPKDGTTPPEGEAPKATVPLPVFKATIRGKEYTGEELAKAYENSFDGALKLNNNFKQAQQYIGTLEAKVTDLEAKALEIPPFKLLSDEEIEGLSTAKQTEYIIKRTAWEQQKENSKKELAELKENQKAMEAEVKDFVYKRSHQMFDNPKEWPNYRELVPVMEQILDIIPELGGKKETPDILYYAALGFQKSKESRVVKSEEEKAREETAAQAKASAIATGSGNPPAPVTTTVTDDDSDEAFNKRLLSKQAGGIFRT